MCRLMVYSGTCTTCGEYQTWHDLTNQLACLVSKNNSGFGECDSGVFVEEHDFDQECDQCEQKDEGIGDVEEVEPAISSTKRGADEKESSSGRKKQKTW
ncbi:hypothetical protein CDD81_2542 [Ophiocordyceps australis]|uniref:Uncharacterized protein n=1 Tax=Ophiocordyceps australis TaxID=1399860 RepID=A0A2C5XK43_9HYPO|nr:hypothetical protein CDD81_2542 [Ophiocordyceps australis]